MSDLGQNINLHVSVDCVLIGFDGEHFSVLLVKQLGKQQELIANHEAQINTLNDKVQNAVFSQGLITIAEIDGICSM